MSYQDTGLPFIYGLTLAIQEETHTNQEENTEMLKNGRLLHNHNWIALETEIHPPSETIYHKDNVVLPAKFEKHCITKLYCPVCKEVQEITV